LANSVAAPIGQLTCMSCPDACITGTTFPLLQIEFWTFKVAMLALFVREFYGFMKYKWKHCPDLPPKGSEPGL
jgi:hypothetical protein